MEGMVCFELEIGEVGSWKGIRDLEKMMCEIEEMSWNNEWCDIKGKVGLNRSKEYG